MIDQPQGELEKTVGVGGAVCVMKMYNHRDANVAAEFIGKGHKFVVNQVTRQVGKSFADGGGDSFNATTNQGTSAKQNKFRHPWQRPGPVGLPRTYLDRHAHVQNTDNISTSSASGRVYEFVVEPAEILGMPETAFILVDNGGHGRRVIMVDGNPGICLLDRVATTLAK